MNVKFIFKDLPGRYRTSLSVFQPMLPFQQLARKAILSIPQKFENVKFILQKSSKRANFAESPFTVLLSIQQILVNVKFIFLIAAEQFVLIRIWTAAEPKFDGRAARYAPLTDSGIDNNSVRTRLLCADKRITP